MKKMSDAKTKSVKGGAAVTTKVATKDKELKKGLISLIKACGLDGEIATELTKGKKTMTTAQVTKLAGTRKK